MLNPVWSSLALVFVLTILLVVQLATFWQLRRHDAKVLKVLEQARRAEKHAYRQTEQLFSLFSILRIGQPLPAMRGYAVSPDFAALLVSRLLEHRPKFVLELGSGVSSLVTGYCLAEMGGGSLLSVDHDEAYAHKSRAQVARHGLDHLVTVVHAPLEEVAVEGRTSPWYRLSCLGPPRPVDLLIVDGPPGTLGPLARYPALPLLVDWLNDGAVILVDDGDRPDEREMVARWARAFPGTTVEFVPTEKGAYVVTLNKGVAVSS